MSANRGRVPVAATILVASLSAVACFLAPPPPRTDVEVVGCYALTLEGIPESIADSLRYEIPGMIKLDAVRVGQVRNSPAS